MSYLDEFCIWFRRQVPSSRLELLVTVLQMLHPLELRFMAACVEELAKRDYFFFRDSESRSNSNEEVSQLTNLSDSQCRSRLVVALSLLYSGNYSTSAILYRTLLNLHQVFDQLPKTKEVIDEIILMLVMAKHHPAFKFDQRAEVAELLDKIASAANTEPIVGSEASASTAASASIGEKRNRVAAENKTISKKEMVDKTVQAFDDQVLVCCVCRDHGPIPVASGGDSSNMPCSDLIPIYVKNIVVKGSRKVENEEMYDLHVAWSNGDETEVSKTVQNMYDFHRQLLDWYPRDTGAWGSARKIPYFPGYRDGSSGESTSKENVSREVYEYVKDLVKIAPDVLRSEYTLKFFNATAPVRSVTTAANTGSIPDAATVVGDSVSKRPSVLDPGSSEETDCVDADGRVKSLTFFNSQVTPKKKETRENATKESAAGQQQSGEEQVQPAARVSSKRASKKSRKSTKTRSQSPSSKTPTTESTATITSPLSTTTDLGQEISTTSTISLGSSCGGGKAVRKTSTSSSSSTKQFIPQPLYAVLNRDGLVEDYKNYLAPRGIDELNAMTESDIVKAGLPLEICSPIINAVKNYMMTKHLNGTVVPKFSAADLVAGDVFFVQPGHRRSTPPILDLRGGSVGPDGMPLLTPMATIGGVPYLSVGPLAVETSLPPGSAISGKFAYVDTMNGPIMSASCSSQLSESTAGTMDISMVTAMDAHSVQSRILASSHSDTTITAHTPRQLSSDEHSLISANAWAQRSLEDELPSGARSYSVDSSDAATTASIPYLANYTAATSTSLPPSQSQSPAPIESQHQVQQHQTPFYPTMPGVAVSTTSTVPIQQQQQYHANANQQQQHYQRNSKPTYRSALPNYSYKGNQPNRRNYAPAMDYNRPQQQQHHMYQMPHQSMNAHHQAALSAAIPAANLVRAPPPGQAQLITSQHHHPRARLSCQHCNGASTACPFCANGNWNNAILTTASATGGPLLFHLTSPTGPPPTPAQLFSPPFAGAAAPQPPGTNGPSTQQFFTSPPPRFHLHSPNMAIFKSASATMVNSEQQHFMHAAAIDHQQTMSMIETTTNSALFDLEAGGGSCCNCGMKGHTIGACTNPTLEQIIAAGHFHLNIAAKEENATLASQDR